VLPERCQVDHPVRVGRRSVSPRSLSGLYRKHLNESWPIPRLLPTQYSRMELLPRRENMIRHHWGNQEPLEQNEQQTFHEVDMFWPQTKRASDPRTDLQQKASLQVTSEVPS
jgi:hypothetical protein